VPQKPETITNFINIPLKCTITKKQNEHEYNINIHKYGTKHRGMTIRLTEQQIKDLQWWY
jgi:hypothetical protein